MRYTVFFLILIVVSCSSEKKNSSGKDSYDHELELIRMEAVDAAMHKDFSRSDSLGRVLYKEADNKDNDRYRAYGLLTQSFYNFSTANLDNRFQRVKEAEKIALSLGNDTLLSRVYSTLGGYSAIGFYNLSDAKKYYTEALRFSRQAGAPDFVLANECNLSELYHTLGDTMSIELDLEIFNKSLKSDNIGLLVAAAQHCAEYYLLKPNTASKALPFIEKLHELGENYKYHHLMGKYYLISEDDAKAKNELDSALSIYNTSPGAYLTYGNLLNKQKNYVASIKMLEEALAIFNQIDFNNPAKVEIFRLQADNFRNTMQYEKALENFDRYTHLKDSINKVRTADELQKYKVKYETERKESELITLRSANRQKDIILIGIGIILSLSVVFIVFYLYRRNRLHQIIADQSQEYLGRINRDEILAENGLEETKDEKSIPEENISTSVYPGLSEEKANSIWKKIEDLMDNQQIWRKRELTRDSFSEEVGCNHTWLSAVIKKKTGMTYLQYINFRRVREAVNILSHKNCDLNQKDIAYQVGFASVSTYYSAFKAKMDMSPAEFRRHIEHGFSS